MSAAEPGTLVYQPYTVEGEPLARIFYEVYRDRAAHADHELQPHTVKISWRRFARSSRRFGSRPAPRSSQTEQTSQRLAGGPAAVDDERVAGDESRRR